MNGHVFFSLFFSLSPTELRAVRELQIGIRLQIEIQKAENPQAHKSSATERQNAATPMADLRWCCDSQVWTSESIRSSLSWPLPSAASVSSRAHVFESALLLRWREGQETTALTFDHALLNLFETLDARDDERERVRRVEERQEASQSEEGLRATAAECQSLSTCTISSSSSRWTYTTMTSYEIGMQPHGWRLSFQRGARAQQRQHRDGAHHDGCSTVICARPEVLFGRSPVEQNEKNQPAAPLVRRSGSASDYSRDGHEATACRRGTNSRWSTSTAIRATTCQIQQHSTNSEVPARRTIVAMKPAVRPSPTVDTPRAISNGVESDDMVVVRRAVCEAAGDSKTRRVGSQGD